MIRQLEVTDHHSSRSFAEHSGTIDGITFATRCSPTPCFFSVDLLSIVAAKELAPWDGCFRCLFSRALPAIHWGEIAKLCLAYV